MAPRKEYYSILGISREASQDEIRRAYRSRAFELHPDRNGGTKAAEEAFKELTEAYAVLGDPDRRASYDAFGRSAPGSSKPFQGADLFDDLFRNPAFGNLFQQLAAEFARQGLRFDEGYFRRFSGHTQGGAAFGGFVFVGSIGDLFTTLAKQRRQRVEERARPELKHRKPGLLRRLLQALPASLGVAEEDLNVRYELPVEPNVLRAGGSIRVTLPGSAGQKTYDVRIPAGSAPGTLLRLPGQGREGRTRRGDAYLELKGEDS